jgi:pathogenesis-related protein 1
MPEMPIRSLTAHLALTFSITLLGSCDRERQPSPIEPEPAVTGPGPSGETTKSDGEGRSSTGTQQDRRRPPARRPDSKPAPDSKPVPAAEPFADAFVAAHNQHRAQVSPAAKPALPPVTWSNELAAQARAWAERCKFDHSKTDLGENLSARTDMADPEVIVAAWAAEGEAFDYAHNRCASGEVCGHYTQVVWRDSTQIGCGMAQCGAGGPFGDQAWIMWVCNYSPAGNWSGQKPY